MRDITINGVPLSPHWESVGEGRAPSGGSVILEVRVQHDWIGSGLDREILGYAEGELADIYIESGPYYKGADVVKMMRLYGREDLAVQIAAILIRGL